MSIPIHLLTDFSCCEDFENFLRSQNHANRALLDSLTAQVVGEWNKKACNLAIMGSNICLLDKDGVTLATVPALLQDDDTITRDNLTGTIKCVRIVAQGANHSIGVWIGTHEQYKALKDKNHQKTAYFFTDVNLSDVYEDLLTVKNWMLSVKNGTASVKYANEAQYADSAGSATYATNADYATAAGTADLAKKATNADYASSAGNATTALNATYAGTASKAASADKASKDGDGNIISDTYGNFGNDFTRYNGGLLQTGTYQFVFDDINVYYSVIVHYKAGATTLRIYLGYHDTLTANFYMDIKSSIANVYYIFADGSIVDEDWVDAGAIYYRRIGN